MPHENYFLSFCTIFNKKIYFLLTIWSIDQLWNLNKPLCYLYPHQSISRFKILLYHAQTSMKLYSFVSINNAHKMRGTSLFTLHKLKFHFRNKEAIEQKWSETSGSLRFDFVTTFRANELFLLEALHNNRYKEKNESGKDKKDNPWPRYPTQFINCFHFTFILALLTFIYSSIFLERIVIFKSVKGIFGRSVLNFVW